LPLFFTGIKIIQFALKIANTLMNDHKEILVCTEPVPLNFGG